MKNSTEFVGMTVVKRLRVSLANDPALLRRIFAAVWGLVYARAGILGITGSFGAALVAGVGYDDTLYACFGAAAGYLLVSDPSANVGFLLLCAIAAGVKLVAGRNWWNSHSWAPCGIAGISALLVGFPVLFLTGSQITDYVILAAQGILAVATAYFVSRLYVAGELVLTRRGRMADTALVICLCIFAGGLVSLEAAGVSAGRAAAVLLTVCAGYALGGANGAAVGAAGGLAVAFVSGNFSVTIALYALGGLFAGAFRPLGRMGSAVAFILCSGFVMLAAGRQMPLSSFIEVLIGTVGFIALPERLLSRVVRAFAPEALDEGAARRIISKRLQGGVEALRAIGADTRQVALTLEAKSGPGLADLPDTISGKICRRCPKNTLCWTQNYGETQTVINNLVEQIRRDDAPHLDLLPDWFVQRCTQPAKLAQAATEQYHNFVAKLGARRRVSRVRSVVTDQFEGMAMFLAGIEEEVRNCTPAGPVVNARVREAFSRWGVEPFALSCVVGRGHRLQIEAKLPLAEGQRVDRKTLSRLVGEAAGRSFAPAVTTVKDGCLELVLQERTRYKAVVESCQSSQREGTICGDTWRSFTTADGRLHILLSDGMGCGGSASLDSAMAVGLMGRLVQAGADYNSALHMVNSALLVKSGEESLATLDAAVIDLYTGKTELYKAGAAPTILRQGKRAGSVESISSPAGILNGALFECSTVTLKEGDWLVMLSDGATAAGVDWITDEVEHYVQENPRQLAERLERAARLRRSDGRSDDITVICLRLEAESY